MRLQSKRSVEEASFIFHLTFYTGEVRNLVCDFIPDAMILVGRAVLMGETSFEVDHKWIELDHHRMIM